VAYPLRLTALLLSLSARPFTPAAPVPRAASNVSQQPPERLDRGRFTAVFYPGERVLATSLLESAVHSDTFPGLPRPTQRVLLAVAPDRRRFRDWVGPGAPEWGAAITFPESRRVVMQGRSAGADAGDPREVLRHELAHLALHEYLGDLPPRWFDEGYASYAAREWSREDALAANVALAVRGTPSFGELDDAFEAGSSAAQNAYALAYRAVVELVALDPANGLSRFFLAWHQQRTMDRALRATYGMTLTQFEQRWQQRTRRRYGALALVSNLTLAGLVLLFVIMPLYLARRYRDRRRLAELRVADEAADRAARESVLDAMLGRDDMPDFGDGTPPLPPG
jgi:hypothetical protein